MNLQALIFDVDGTLADTERDGHRVSFNQAFKDAGLDWEWDVPLYGKLLEVTGGKERMLHYAKQFDPEFANHPDATTRIANLHKAKTQLYVDLVARGGLPLRPGVARLLREARHAGLRLAIATTTTPENVTALLHAALGPESTSWFEVIGAGDVVPAKKPAPDIYNWVLERMQLPPHACLALEDSGPGLKAARGAGLPTVVTVSDYTRDHDFKGAAIVLSDLGEPQQPAQILSGEVTPYPYASIQALRDWHTSGLIQSVPV